jgi:hypothetical protein
LGGENRRFLARVGNSVRTSPTDFGEPVNTSKYWAVALAAALTALATVPAAASATAQTPTAGRMVLTNADNDREVTLAVGNDLEVRLTATRGNGLTWSWSTPLSSPPDGLRRTGGSVTPGGDARAVFHAEHAGANTISADRRCRPNPGRICPGVVALWKVTVDVK